MQPRSEERGEGSHVLLTLRRSPWLQCSRVLKNAESAQERQRCARGSPASMQPRSEERGEAPLLARDHSDAPASMQPRSEERGEVETRLHRQPSLNSASMQPRSEERGERARCWSFGHPGIRFNAAAF